MLITTIYVKTNSNVALIDSLAKGEETAKNKLTHVGDFYMILFLYFYLFEMGIIIICYLFVI